MRIDAPPSPRVATCVGALMWAVQPLYIVAELLTATAVATSYSLIDNTISDLGATSCTSIGYSFGQVAVCSPRHMLLNVSFIVFGLLLAAGALLLRGWLGGRLASGTSVALWVLAGLSSIATGLIPLDQDLELHAAVSLPVFLAQPLALLATAVALRHRLVLACSALAIGVVSLMGAVLYLARVDSAELGGLFERLALWPSYLWLPVLAVVIFRDSRRDTRRAATT